MTEITDEAKHAALDAFYGRDRWINNIQKPAMLADMTRALSAVLPHLRPADAQRSWAEIAAGVPSAAFTQNAVAGREIVDRVDAHLRPAAEAPEGETRRVVQFQVVGEGAELEASYWVLLSDGSVWWCELDAASDRTGIWWPAPDIFDIPLPVVPVVAGVAKGAGE